MDRSSIIPFSIFHFDASLETTLYPKMYAKTPRAFIFILRVLPFLIFWLVGKQSVATAFSLAMSSSKTIYEVPNSGWTSPQWNWGYGAGTGHECAAICRQRYNSRQVRAALIKDLCTSPTIEIENREPTNFEEVKLILALAWQRGRWDGSDGGKGGYGDVLATMADASRYESDDEKEDSIRLVKDMTGRFRLLGPSKEQTDEMENVLAILLENDKDAARRKCSGMVLEAMGFIENGL
jgi:hypothetical protein